MLDLLEVIEPNSIDSVVTDPPYELNFMNKGWDNSGIAFQVDTWKKCYEALKPGGYLLAFGGSRTFHRIACTIEDAGFEIRDTIMWLYGSGFPKSMNIGLAIDKKNGVESKVVGTGKSGSTSKAFNLREEQEKAGNGVLAGEYSIKEAQNEWNGWGTALKPSYEPIIVARKPFKGSLVDNVMEHGVGGINIDECRVDLEEGYEFKQTTRHSRTNNVFTDDSCGFKAETYTIASANPDGRFPANTILTYGESDREEVCGGFPDTKSAVRKPSGGKILNPDSGWNNNSMVDKTTRGFEDSGSAARYFKNCAYTEEDLKDADFTSSLMPNFEPIIVARKPVEGTTIDNVMKYGVGGINIDECRVGDEERTYKGMSKHKPDGAGTLRDDNWVPKDIEVSVNGRFPANTILTYDETDKEEVCGGFPDTKSSKTNSKLLDIRGNNYNNAHKTLEVAYERGYTDEGSAARYFYCAKASKKDRDEGLDRFETKKTGELQGGRQEGSAGSIMLNADGTTRVNPYAGGGTPKKNIHPTVKPTSLMQYLVRLVTPNGGTILDPFNGSGSTGKAVMYENKEHHKGYKYIGIELSEEYLAISKARIEYVIEKEDPEEDPNQISMF